MCPFADIPGKPGTPEIVDYDVDRVDLKWEPPASSGGAPITGYIIEKKEKFSPAWSEILTTTVSIIPHALQSQASSYIYIMSKLYRGPRAKPKSPDSRKVISISSVLERSIRLVLASLARPQNHILPKHATVSVWDLQLIRILKHGCNGILCAS